MDPEPQALDGKVAIITGASSGIGRAMARSLAASDSRLVLVARSPENLEAVAAALDAETLVAPADVADYAAVRVVVDRAVDRFGRIDIMFANAGVYFPGQFVDSDPTAWSKLLDVNIDGVLNCAHAVLDQMKAQASGDILVTSSIAGHSELRDEPIYSPSKHAVQTFVHTLRRQVAAMGTWQVEGSGVRRGVRADADPGDSRGRFRSLRRRGTKPLALLIRKAEVVAAVAGFAPLRQRPEPTGTTLSSRTAQ